MYLLRYFMILLYGILTTLTLTAQEQRSANYITSTMSFGLCSGEQEIGVGLPFSVGWQKRMGKKQKLYINPTLFNGGFRPVAISDTRDQFFRMSMVSIQLHYDLIRYNRVALQTSGGAFLSYSRGLFGTGGDPEFNHQSSSYFYKIYYGFQVSLGIRVEAKNKKRAFRLIPLTVHMGNNDFLLGYISFGVDFRLSNE